MKKWQQPRSSFTTTSRRCAAWSPRPIRPGERKRTNGAAAVEQDLLPSDECAWVSCGGGGDGGGESGNPAAADGPQRPHPAESRASERKPHRRPSGSGFQRLEGFDGFSLECSLVLRNLVPGTLNISIGRTPPTPSRIVGIHRQKTHCRQCRYRFPCWFDL